MPDMRSFLLSLWRPLEDAGLLVGGVVRHLSCSVRERAVNLRNHRSAFTDGSRNTLGRSRPHLADGKNAGPARFQRKGRAADRTVAVGKFGAGDDEAFAVDLHALLEPICVRVGADKQEDMP